MDGTNHATYARARNDPEQFRDLTQRAGLSSVIVVALDLDDFTLINDTHGHDVGDELLRHIAQNLRSAIRLPDTLARLGGDEFIIIATDLPSDQPADLIARTSATRISHALRKAVNINGNALNVTGSIGVAVYPDDTTDEVLLRRLADQRMYAFKTKPISRAPSSYHDIQATAI